MLECIRGGALSPRVGIRGDKTEEQSGKEIRDESAFVVENASNLSAVSAD